MHRRRGVKWGKRGRGKFPPLFFSDEDTLQLLNTSGLTITKVRIGCHSHY